MALKEQLGLRLKGQRVSLVDIAHRTLKEAIVTRKLYPGESVTEERLSGELGISRSILREALQRLQSDGLLEREDNGRMKVAAISQKDVHNLYAARSAIEQVAVAEAFERMTKPQLERLELALHQLKVSTSLGSSDEITIAGDRIHDLIFEIADNPVLIQLREILRPRIDRYRNLSVSALTRHRESLSEVEDIVRAFKGRSSSSAKAAMARHIAGSERASIASFQNSLAGK